MKAVALSRECQVMDLSLNGAKIVADIGVEVWRRRALLLSLIGQLARLADT
jgi:hypothetical protein